MNRIICCSISEFLIPFNEENDAIKNKQNLDNDDCN